MHVGTRSIKLFPNPTVTFWPVLECNVFCENSHLQFDLRIHIEHMGRYPHDGNFVCSGDFKKKM